jgi:hypothetical protein
MKKVIHCEKTFPQGFKEKVEDFITTETRDTLSTKSILLVSVYMLEIAAAALD